MKLTNKEADFLCWQESYYKNNVRPDNHRAARFAWRMARRVFPRLRKFRCPI